MRRMYSQKQLEKIVDNVVEEKDITPVSGTSDGTNWTSLTVGDETHGFASGGGGSVAWNDITDKPTFATVATSGSYNDLSNKPTIPSATSDLTNDSGFITNSVSNLTNYYDKSDVDSIAENIASDIPDAVSGTNDGTNWTSLTIGNTTKNIPSGGGSGEGFTVVELDFSSNYESDFNVDITSKFDAATLAAIRANPEKYIIKTSFTETGYKRNRYFYLMNDMVNATHETEDYVVYSSIWEGSTPGNPIAYLECHGVIQFNFVLSTVTWQPKLPIIAGKKPTAAGSYMWTVTVDAYGNPTYAWQIIQ